MKYFMIAWESSANATSLPDDAVIEHLKKYIKTPSGDLEGVDEFCEDLQLIETRVSNLVFLKAKNDELSENDIAHWIIAKDYSQKIFYNRGQFFVKEVFDSYPLLMIKQ